MIVAQEIGEGVPEVHVEDVSTAVVAAEGDVSAANDVVLLVLKNHLSHPLHHLLHHHKHHKINLQLPKYNLHYLNHLKVNHNHLNINHNLHMMLDY
nr:hypothetical protein [Tanacetum cinerariifolium]